MLKTEAKRPSKVKKNWMLKTEARRFKTKNPNQERYHLKQKKNRDKIRKKLHQSRPFDLNSQGPLWWVAFVDP